MPNLRADVFSSGLALLGESPVYQPEQDALLWVDIELGTAYRQPLDRGAPQSLALGQAVGAVFLREREGLAYALQDGLAIADAWGGPLQLVTPIERADTTRRMNDGKCDAHGRVWVGTMAKDAAPKQGTLYRIDADHRELPMVSGLTIPNGLCFSADDKQMFYIDSVLRRVDVFDYDGDLGTLRNRRVLFTIPEALGGPDGMTIDDSGALWIAHFGGAAVRRYTLDGVVDRTIELPVSQVTSCAFGGAHHDQLFITTASVGLSAAMQAREPLAGSVFVARPGVRGLPVHRYGG